MKRFIMLLLMSFLIIGCQNNDDKEKPIDENSKVESALVETKDKKEEILNLLESDGIKDMQVVKDTKENLVFENNSCQISITLENDKTTKITSKSRFNDDEYSCIFRTLIKDKDLLGRDKKDFEEYMELFRDKEEFNIKGISVKRSNDNIEFIKEN